MNGMLEARIAASEFEQTSHQMPAIPWSLTTPAEADRHLLLLEQLADLRSHVAAVPSLRSTRA